MFLQLKLFGRSVNDALNETVVVRSRSTGTFDCHTATIVRSGEICPAGLSSVKVPVHIYADCKFAGRIRIVGYYKFHFSEIAQRFELRLSELDWSYPAKSSRTTVSVCTVLKVQLVVCS